MKYNKLVKKGIILFVFLVYIPNLNAQKDKVFEEYLASFTEIHLTKSLYLFSNYTEYPVNYYDIEDTQIKFVENVMPNIDKATMIRPWLLYKINNIYLVIMVYELEDKKVFNKNKNDFYFIFYDESGNVINSYNLLRGADQQWFKDGVNYDVKLFISEDRIMYLLYGPYKVPEMEANCKEVIYEIKDSGSLEKLSERNYQAEKIDQWNW
jgi:hypothetical protein